MDKWRFTIGTILVGCLLVWLYPQSASDDASGRTDVTIWFSGVTYGRHSEAIDAFERRFPEYRAILGSSAVRTNLEGEGNPQRLMCGIAGGVPPEVVEYDRFAICQWASRGAFLDLTPLIEKDQREFDEARRKLATLRETFEQQPGDATSQAVSEQEELVSRLEMHLIRSEDYYRQPWEECQYRDPESDTAGQFGIPNYMDDRVLYYNTDMLVRAGLVDDQGKPRPPASWEAILTKRLDFADATVTEAHIRSDSADFVEAGVRPGDTLSLIQDNGRVTRCLVDRIAGRHELSIRSAYAKKTLSLPNGRNHHIKIFDQNSYTLKLSQWDDQGRMRVAGFEPYHGNAWLYLYGWSNGGRFLTEDGLTCTLNDPRIVEALEWTTDVYDALGGYDEVTAFRKSFQSLAQDPFIMGQIAAFIHGDWFMRDLLRYKPDMRFATAPAPRHSVCWTRAAPHAPGSPASPTAFQQPVPRTSWTLPGHSSNTWPRSKPARS